MPQNRNRNRNKPNRNKPNRNKPNQNQGKRKGSGPGKTAKVKGPGKQVETKTYKGLYEPGEILRGPDLKRAVFQTVNAQINPALRDIRSNIRSLGKERDFEVGRERRLGEQALGNTKQYYDSLAQHERNLLASRSGAEAALQTTLAGIGADTQTALSGAGSAVTAGLGENTGGQEIGSRERLAQMMAEQIGNAARENATTRGLAAGQGTAAQNLIAELGVTGQIRGAELTSKGQGEVRNAMQRIRNEYAKEIGKQRQSRNELIEKRPELMNSALMQFREGERNQEATDAALGIERAELRQKGKESGEGIRYAKVNAREQLKVLQQKQKNRLEEMQEQGASYAQLNAEKSQQNKEYLELQAQLTRENNEAKQAGSLNYLNRATQAYGGKEGKGKEGYREFGNVFSYLRSSGVPRKILATDKKARRAAYDKLRKYGASDADAKKAIKRYIKQYKRFGTKDPNNKSLGR